MSLAIDIDKVTEVLIGDQWHTVCDASLKSDAYEYVYYTLNDPYGEKPIIFKEHEQLGFKFRSPYGNIAGPFSAIQAVRTEQEY